MNTRSILTLSTVLGLVSALVFSTCTKSPSGSEAARAELLNVSYDATRELYAAIDSAFAKSWRDKTGQEMAVKQSHGGSGKQARSVIDGLPADVVTLALAYDIDAIADNAKLLPEDWQQRLPHNSTPYTSTIVFLVRKGNPKGIKDWDDLLKPGVIVVTPNPKTSGAARWNYLAVWAYAKAKYGSDDAAKDFLKQLYDQKRVPTLGTSARDSTVTFAQSGIGDVLLTWENEAHLALKEFGADKFEVVAPSLSILAEPPVALVDTNVDKKGTRAVAQAFLEFLYTDEAQDIIGKNYYRPVGEKAKAKYAAQFPEIKMVAIADFGGWRAAQKEHFADGGTFDQIYTQPK